MTRSTPGLAAKLRGRLRALRAGARASCLAQSTIPPVAKRISAAHVDKYRRDGVVVIRGIADAALPAAPYTVALPRPAAGRPSRTPFREVRDGRGVGGGVFGVSPGAPNSMRRQGPL